MKTFTALFFCLLISCNLHTEHEQTAGNTWVYDSYNETNQTHKYKKRSAFQKDKSGLQFLSDGKLVKRQNRGWCGTPPIAFENAEGQWSRISENKISITYNFWGGVGKMALEIVSETATWVEVKRYDIEN